MASVGLHLNLHNQNISWVLWRKLVQSRPKVFGHFTKFATQGRRCSSPPSPQELYSTNALGQGVLKIVKMQNLGQKLDTAPFWNKWAHLHKHYAPAMFWGRRVQSSDFALQRRLWVAFCWMLCQAHDCQELYWFSGLCCKLILASVRWWPGLTNAVKVAPENIKESSFRLTNRAFYIFWIQSPINISSPRVSENFD